MSSKKGDNPSIIALNFIYLEAAPSVILISLFIFLQFYLNYQSQVVVLRLLNIQF